MRVTSAFVLAPLVSVAGLGIYGLIYSAFAQQDPVLVWALILVGLMLFAIPPTLFIALPIVLSIGRRPLLKECLLVGALLGGMPYGLLAALLAIADPSALLSALLGISMAFSLGVLGGTCFWFVAYGGRTPRPENTLRHGR